VIENDIHGPRPRGGDINSVTAMVRNHCIRHGQIAGCTRHEHDTRTTSNISNQAILNAQRRAGVERNSVSSRTDPVDQQPSQIDLVCCPRVDRNGVAARCCNASEAVALNADRLGDGHRAVARRIEHVDLAASRHGVVPLLEAAAGLREGAGAAVQSLCGDEDARRLRSSDRGAKAEHEQRRGYSGECELEHWSPSNDVDGGQNSIRRDVRHARAGARAAPTKVASGYIGPCGETLARRTRLDLPERYRRCGETPPLWSRSSAEAHRVSSGMVLVGSIADDRRIRA